MRRRRPRTVLVPLLAALLSLPFAGCSLFGDVDLDVDGVRAAYVDVPTDAGRREALVVEPDALAAASDGSTFPMVVALHGFRSDAEQMARITGLPLEARDRRFLAVFGVGLDKSWNAGSCCGSSATDGVDDVAYLQALVLTMLSRYPVDRARVYLLGYSNGAMLAYRFLCASPAIVTSVASVAGTNTTGCRMTEPRPFLQVSGDDDPIVPVDGSKVPTAPGVGPTPSVRLSVDGVADDLGCPRPTTLRLGPVVEQRRAPCRGGVEVVFDLVHAISHGWPVGGPFSTTRRVLQFWGLA